MRAVTRLRSGGITRARCVPFDPPVCADTAPAQAPYSPLPGAVNDKYEDSPGSPKPAFPLVKQDNLIFFALIPPGGRAGRYNGCVGRGCPEPGGPMALDYIDRIADLGACGPALGWLRSEQYPTLQEAWDACPRGDWMLWLLSTVSDPAYPDAQERVWRSTPEVCTAFDIVWNHREYGTSDPEYLAALANLGMVKARAVRAAVPVAPSLP